MNHLAHALLADPAGNEFALGSAQGDFVHGRPDMAWPPARRAGLRFHRAIDVYTDAHPAVVAARNLFQPPLRRYAGIVLDVWFDHLLVVGWGRLVETEGLPHFAQRWLGLLDTHVAELPPKLGGFLAWMHAHHLPEAYGEPATLRAVFRGVAARLSRPSPVADALPSLQARAPRLQACFDAFFPDLVAYAAGQRPAIPGVSPDPAAVPRDSR